MHATKRTATVNKNKQQGQHQSYRIFSTQAEKLFLDQATADPPLKLHLTLSPQHEHSVHNTDTQSPTLTTSPQHEHTNPNTDNQYPIRTHSPKHEHSAPITNTVPNTNIQCLTRTPSPQY